MPPPPPPSPPTPTFPADPGRWERGDWAFDPEADEPWEDPKILRRRIGTPEELAAVADAIVLGYEITDTDPDGQTRVIVGMVGDVTKLLDCGHGIGEHVVVENLRALIVAVQAHPDVRLARVETEEDEDSHMRVLRRWVSDSENNELDEKPTELRLWHSVVAKTHNDGEGYGGLGIGVTLRAACRFAGTALFKGACFIGIAVFDHAHFTRAARFVGSRFAGDARFDYAHFTGDTGFGGAHFDKDAVFHRARFAGQVTFIDACFTGTARFDHAHCAGDALFFFARFAGDARFFYTCFGGDAWFNMSKFYGDALFNKARVRHSARLLFVGTRFNQSVRFDGDPESTRPLIRGRIFFTDATLDERLTFANTRFGRHARLGFNRFLARGGATIELTREQLRLTNPIPADRPLRRACWHMRGWFAFFDRSRMVMEGADSNNPDAIDRAADDYELLAANYARQPATDREEDGCRWMANELRRRAGVIRTMASRRAFMHAPLERGRMLAGRGEGWLTWYLEYLVLIWSCARAYAALGVGAARDWIWRWCIRRTMVGYLLQWHRIVMTGVVMILVCAVVFGVFAGADTITHGGTAPGTPPWEAWGWFDRARFGVYFSLTTFVTLGYGDYAPTGWFKLVTGFEALLGVSLLSLFTVAWGRKMVR